VTPVLKSLHWLTELMNALNINSFLSHTRFTQLTNLSISYAWFLFNPVATTVLHLPAFLWKSHHSSVCVTLSVEWTPLWTLQASPDTVFFTFTSCHTWSPSFSSSPVSSSLTPTVFHSQLKTISLPTGLIPWTIWPFNVLFCSTAGLGVLDWAGS